MTASDSDRASSSETSEVSDAIFSPSTRAAASRLSGEVESVALARELLSDHPEFGRGRGSKVTLEATGGQRRTGEEWLDAIARVVAERGLEGDIIHGKLALVALAEIDPDLAPQLRKDGFLRAVEAEMADHQSRGFPPGGRALRAEGTAVTMHTDNPAATDALNRRPFAEFLASRIRMIRAQEEGDAEGAFLLHIDGAWGSGKTTLLGFLEEALGRDEPPSRFSGASGETSSPEDNGTGDGEARQELQVAPLGLEPATNPSPTTGKWVVVNFNAWRNQNIDPPWWALRQAVLSAVIDQTENRRVARAERWWRVWAPIKPHVLTLGIVSVFAALLAVVASRTGFFGLAGEAGEYGFSKFFADIARAVGILSGFWVVAGAALQRLSPALPRGAQAFAESQETPMKLLRERFHTVVKGAGWPVAIFIDDVDRCDPGYVVKLLEGVQTLFRDAPVTYVVAGDGRWIEGSYDELYEPLQDAVSDRGRTLGSLFLEKAFQVTVELPTIKNPGEFWESLLRRSGGVNSGPEGGTAEYATMIAALREAKTPNDIDTVSAEARRALSPSLYQSFVNESLDRELDPDVLAQTESALRGFHVFLDRNPRTMKRFLNSYAVQRAAAKYVGVLDGTDLDQPWKQLALWTVIQMRWPSLARALRRDPSVLRLFTGGNADRDVNDDIKNLSRDPRVIQVVKGDEVGVPLTEEAIRTLYALPVYVALPGSREPNAGASAPTTLSL